MEVTFKQFEESDYQRVCDFFVELNREKKHINWNWARWEWMYFHPYTDKDLLKAMGLWLAEGSVVGAAVCDMFFGEAFCGALPGFEDLLLEIVDYAAENLKDEKGLGIAVREEDAGMKRLLAERGFYRVQQRETILRLSLEKPLMWTLPETLTIREIDLERDYYQYQFVIWQGFDHGSDVVEFEKTLSAKAPGYRHMDPRLQLAVADGKGNFLAHCGCWYDPRTDYAYVEPVCVIPEYRGRGLGRAVVSEALNRCHALGAKEAYVLSEDGFYKRLGFAEDSSFWFYRN